MSTYRSILVIVFCLIAGFCYPQKQGEHNNHALPPKVVQDSTEYELLVLDPGFDIWFNLHATPANDRTNDFYITMNRMGVFNWNQYYITGKHHRVIDSYIDYDPTIDYGIELNRKLYWYFKYVEEFHRINLLR